MSEINDDKPHYFDDDGTELNPDLMPKPALCVSCAKDGAPNEEMLCNLTRLDQQGEFDEFRESAGKEFNVLVAKSEAELKSIEQTYDQKLALQSAVRYWKKKADIHSRKVKTFWCASGIVGLFVLVLLCVETFLFIGPLTLGEIPVWKGSVLLLTAVVGVWALRILVRVLLSNMHLQTDAVERRTMLLTYLALLRRGQGPSEEQRELILQILFRPSATGIVKDDALPPAVAQWLNLVTSS